MPLFLVRVNDYYHVFSNPAEAKAHLQEMYIKENPLSSGETYTLSERKSPEDKTRYVIIHIEGGRAAGLFKEGNCFIKEISAKLN